MTIPRRTDPSTGEPTARPRLVVLAELPHVGSAPIAPPIASVEERKTRTVKSTHPAFVEVVDLDDELETVNFTDRRPTRFVDRAHTDHDWEIEGELHEKRREVRSPRSKNQDKVIRRSSRGKTARRQPSNLGMLLSETHAQIGSFAGLIVTTALVAAGLMMWVMSSRQSNIRSLEEYALPGFRVEAEPALTPVEDIPLADSNLLPETSVTIEPQPSPTTPNRGSAIPAKLSNQASVDSSAAIPQPIIEEITEPSPPLGELSFPVTNTPLALDYSRARHGNNEPLQQLPAVAERPQASSTEPINR